MKRLVFSSVVIAGLVLSFILASINSSNVSAIEGGGIGGTPANPSPDNPRSSSIFVYKLSPGDTKEDAINVINNTSENKTLLIYSVDGQVAGGGGFACAQKAQAPLSVGTWISLDRKEVTLKPNSNEKVNFKLTVPDNAPPGEQNGCIVIQDANSKPVEQGNGIALSFRSAIRVAVTIPGEITKELDFTGFNTTQLENDKIRLSASLRNNGNVSLDTDVHTNIKTLLGNRVRTAGGEFPVLAKSDAQFNFEVDSFFWGGWYKAQAEASYNSVAEESIGEGQHDRTIYSEEKIIFVAPKPLALAIEILFLAVLAGAIAFFIFRNKQLQKLRESSKNYKVKKGDTINSIAKEHNINWKLLARVNNLKAPYSLETGRTIKVPSKKSK